MTIGWNMRKRAIKYTKGEIGKIGAPVKDFLPPPAKLRRAKVRVRRMRLPHPGQTVLYDCLEPLGLSVTDGAKVLGVTRQALNNLINGKSGVSPEMAIRLEKAFGSSARVWLGVQMDYDLAQAMKNERAIKVKRVREAV